MINDRGYYLKVECSEADETVSIIGDKEGLEKLKKNIESLLGRQSAALPADISLLSPEWGGDSLTEDVPSDGKTLIKHLRLYRWE